MRDHFTIEIISDELDEVPVQVERSLFSSIPSQKRVQKIIDAEVVSKNLSKFSESFNDVLSQVKSSVNQYDLSEVEVSVSMNAKGGISFIGSAEGGIGTTIKLKFKKNDIEN
ncbi:hypothetical protein [Roseivirga sp. E12]|uniref:Pepco domain-containing protein n=1 Tax=Roseivirga sp. E12 TaxID=2819237 RepID=UPI001ABD2939|nr:hypothetical protein [Roseivirga sp. E12]MBO3697290.1 hypothetical protein [Roseivirga sp. E12]